MLKHLQIRGSLKTNLLFMFSLVIVGSIMVSVMVCLRISISKLTEDEIAMNAALTRQRFHNIDAEITQFERNVFSGYVTTDLQRLLAEKADSDSMVQRLRIQEAITRMAYSQDAILYMAVSDLNGNIYCAQKNIAMIDSGNIDAFISGQPALRELAGKYRWSIRDGEILAERLLYQTALVRPVGYLMMVVDPAYFERSLHTDQVGYSALVDRSGTVFTASPEISSTEWEDFAQQMGTDKNEEVGKWLQGESERYYAQGYGASSSNWRLLCILPGSHFTSQIEQMRHNAAWIALTAIAISFLCVATITSSLTHKVKLLIRRADDIANGNFYNDIQLENYDELVELSTRLNTLAKQIDQLIQHSVDQEKKNGEIEYKCLELRYQAMQMQLNPHFIYNTLETINSLALLEKRTEISKLICRFAQMFRFSIQRNNHEVNLAEEMDYIQSYLSFYQMAYSNRVKYRIELPEDLRGIMLPSAILQPLVENSLVHGVEKSRRPVEIIVRCFTRERKLHAAVIDNGPGIGPERLEEIHRRLSSEIWEPPASQDDQHLSVGLYSIHRLIVMRFGKEYGVEIESIPNVQTTVQIILPNPKEKE